MIVDGKAIARNIEEKLVTELLFSAPKKVCFVVFDNNSATKQFVKMKTMVAQRVGIEVVVKEFSGVKTTDEAAKKISSINQEEYDGVVVQLPLPPGVDSQKILDMISPEKDIDMLSTVAKQSYLKKKINRTPPVAQAVYEIFESQNFKLSGKKIIVVGAGRLVGEPVHLMLERMKIPHDVVDVKTSEKEKLTLLMKADVVISGAGVPHFIKPEMVKDDVVLIDAGTSELGSKLTGDVSPKCADKALWMTPVPGGVGPITIVNLFRNLM